MARWIERMGDCWQYFIQGGLWERGSGRGLPAAAFSSCGPPKTPSLRLSSGYIALGFPVAFCAIYALHFPCSGLSSKDEIQSAPLTETTYCTSTRRASSRYVGKT